MSRPFRFGVLFGDSTSAGEWPRFARRVEAQGFSTLLAPDHYPTAMAAMPLLAAAAAATTTLRVGTYVSNNDFRHPPMLAKEFATLDVISGGRAELGIGAGWWRREYQQIGLTFDPGPVRFERFEEAVSIIKRLLAGEEVTFAGRYYCLDGLVGAPRPVQRPVPMLIGGGGPRMVRLAAREADIIGFNPQSRPLGGIERTAFGESVFQERINQFDAALAEAGRIGENAPERSLLIFAIAGSADQVDPAYIQPEFVEHSPFALIGDTSQIVDTMLERRERWGLTYYVSLATQIDSVACLVDRLAGV
jgi:probable F420-dependent oxidoreductase